ncbi:unnamed protein product [Didymodactylos carnosus]|uniref:ADP ribosyltransferase domain-containing protein n=1 Tax=Didymodactylos carnosus TaxID=1234261 RepID=A0A815NZT0_9BILA|nr:unnamed protein product [Didymodactylos carnosus]CAF1485224.1 unnamed protein product [Didymodactylos carnosus]CAF4275175.1 unnamed protein product [Didymodactylos carnosus]CAF4315114.1 unnamed protein product [Didymodactylos carnosus]
MVRLDLTQEEKEQLIQLCRNTYKDNQTELNNVREFEHEYESQNALRWYTREAFVYRMINKAFRMRNVEVLLLFRMIIQDIQQQLIQEQLQTTVCLYRGQLMSKEEISELGRLSGKLISMNSFLSTSRSRAYAEMLLDGTDSDITKKGVLFEIEADPRLPNMKPFADISRYSQFTDEQEVLFMAGCIFRIEEVRQDETMTFIKLILCSSDNHELKELFDHAKQETGSVVTLHSLGVILGKAGKLDIAEKCCRGYLKGLPNDDPLRAECYHSLGNILEKRGEYDESLGTHKKCLEIQERTLPTRHPDTAKTHNNMANVYYRKGDYPRARTSYEKALSIFRKAYGQDNASVGGCLHNLGNVYSKEGKYEEALLHYRQALVIYEKVLPDSHMHSAACHNCIGDALRSLGQFDLSMEHVNISLKMKLKSLPADHVDIGTSYKNIGLTHEQKGEYEEALRNCEKAFAIFSHSLSQQHPHVTKIKEDINRIKAKLK